MFTSPLVMPDPVTTDQELKVRVTSPLGTGSLSPHVSASCRSPTPIPHLTQMNPSARSDHQGALWVSVGTSEEVITQWLVMKTRGWNRGCPLLPWELTWSISRKVIPSALVLRSILVLLLPPKKKSAGRGVKCLHASQHRKQGAALELREIRWWNSIVSWNSEHFEIATYTYIFNCISKVPVF